MNTTTDAAQEEPPNLALAHEPPPHGVEELAPEELCARLVDELWAHNALHDAEVERALLRVPRHLFLPQVTLARAYADAAIPTHWEDGMPVSSASQPAIVALMLEQLRLAPGMRVLEIGAGTGYNAALLAELVGPVGAVTTIDIDPQIADEARAHLAAAGYGRVRVLAGDGAAGCAEDAPYDRIILAVGASDISPAWFEQLAEGGILVLPLWLRAAEASIAFRKRDGMLRSESLTPCGFMRLRGTEAATGQWVALTRGWHLVGERAQDVAESVARLLAARPRRRLWMRPPPAFHQYLGLRGARLIALWPDPQRAGHRRLRGRLGLYVEHPDGPSLALFSTGLPFLLCYGSPAAERAIEAEASRWRGTRLPPLESWQVAAFPRAAVAAPPEPPEGAVRLVRRHFTFDILLGPQAAGAATAS
jgi:protein-L-isoaspartate(D-aspartate) O-methyltransferase